MKLLIWDFDGTLAWREGMWSGTLAEILATHAPSFASRRAELRAALQTGFPWHRPEVAHVELSEADAWWHALAPTFERAFQATGLDSTTATSLAARVRAQYCHPSRWEVFPDVVETLERLKARGWTHVILSNHVPELLDIVRSLDLERFFVRILSSAITGYEKPHAIAFAAAIQGFDQIEDVWMIGDSMTVDIAGAEQCGWKTILVHRPHPAAKRYCESLSGVIDLLESI